MLDILNGGSPAKIVCTHWESWEEGTEISCIDCRRTAQRRRMPPPCCPPGISVVAAKQERWASGDRSGLRRITCRAPDGITLASLGVPPPARFFGRAAREFRFEPRAVWEEERRDQVDAVAFGHEVPAPVGVARERRREYRPDGSIVERLRHEIDRRRVELREHMAAAMWPALHHTEE